jgi:membrane associated rhomboid family serine protease
MNNIFGKSRKLVMCQACRGLIESSARSCPLCGRESVPALRVATAAGAESSHFFSRLILSINVVLFVLMGAVELGSGGTVGEYLTSPSMAVLTDFGGRWIPAIQAGQWWRLVTPIFLHLGALHLMFNSIALYVIAPQVEEAFGSQKFIILYLATGIVGNVGSYVFGNNGGGASGAIMGLIGVAAVYGYRLGGMAGRAIMRQMIIWAAIGIVLGGLGGADNANHIWGLLSGVGVAFLIAPGPPETVPAANLWNGAAILGAVLITLSFGMVALNYGKMQHGTDVVRLDRRVRPLVNALDSSLKWSDSGEDDPAKLASQIRSAASDIDQVPHIDSRSDAIRRRLQELASRRAGAMDSAKKEPSAALTGRGPDNDELNLIYKDYQEWIGSIKDEYGLIYQREGS